MNDFEQAHAVVEDIIKDGTLKSDDTFHPYSNQINRERVFSMGSLLIYFEEVFNPKQVDCHAFTARILKMKVKNAYIDFHRWDWFQKPEIIDSYVVVNGFGDKFGVYLSEPLSNGFIPIFSMESKGDGTIGIINRELNKELTKLERSFSVDDDLQAHKEKREKLYMKATVVDIKVVLDTLRNLDFDGLVEISNSNEHEIGRQK